MEYISWKIRAAFEQIAVGNFFIIMGLDITLKYVIISLNKNY